jgi:1-deoxy-D-xylulose-5-phosphate reductoisomerase
MKYLAILGSTGSIGTNALSVVAAHPEAFAVAGLAANRSVDLIERQVQHFRPRLVALYDQAAAQQLCERLRDVNTVEVLAGPAGLEAIATMAEVDLVLEALSGGGGLLPTLRAIEAGKDLAFVNKEVLVMGGALVMDAVKHHGVRLLPVDNEISAIFQCLANACGNKDRQGDLQRLILTASGGPFRHTAVEQLAVVTPQQALRYPNWTMGPKIMIDSATMMKKALRSLRRNGSLIWTWRRSTSSFTPKVSSIPWSSLRTAHF